MKIPSGARMRMPVMLAMAFLLAAGALGAQNTRNVFIVVIDGARYSETFGDQTHQYIPKIWNQLRPAGAVYTSVYNDGWTLTNPGHASIITGSWQCVANDGTERPHRPTLFEYSRKQHNTAQTENYVVLGKDKLNILAYSDYAGYGSAYQAAVQTSASPYDDATTWENIQTAIAAYHPQLVVVNLAQTDAAGHGGIWGDYTAALRQADSLTSELWELIQSDSIYRDRTTMIVANDHGRHTADFSSHGDSCEGCRRIILLVIGPDTPAGIIDSAAYSQIDIAPTAGSLLNIDTPYSDGMIIATACGAGFTPPDGPAPGDFILMQNRPNPFADRTIISYQLATAGPVKLSIYNILGQQVKELVNGLQPAGRYRAGWDGRDDDGRTLPNGLYFYRLKAPGKSTTKKLTIMR